MTSQSAAGILGAIVAIAVLAAAVHYGPIGQFGRPAKARVAAQSPLAVQAAPAVTAPAAGSH
ncbi:MAG: hypothetical protein ACREDL_00990 [Bradyrhizobium sp.]